MKQIKNKYLIFFAIPALFIAGACNKFKDFGDTNINPAGTTKPIISALLSSAEITVSGYAAQVQPGYYCQYFSETQYSASSLYSLPQINFSGEYSGVLYDLQNIILDNSSNNMSQVARILKAYVYWTITDRWGDIPYSEALKGSESKYFPKYDTQESIYKDLIKELKEASSKFDDGVSAIKGDIIYSGDIAKWKKLANSLKMLMTLNLSKKYPGASGYAATEFKAALTDGAGNISTNADNFKLTYPGGTFKSPWYSQYDGRKDNGESATMTTILGGFGDTRQSAYGSSATGVPYGWKRENIDPWTSANPNWARILSPTFRPETGTINVITAAEVLLGRAEAADRGWTTEVAATILQNGVTVSFEQWGLAAPAASYFTQTGVAFTAASGTGANIQQIAIQRYLATYPDGEQGWNIWRVTGYPLLTPAPDAINSSKKIPRRNTYGQNEYGSNGQNVKAAAALLPGGDIQDAKIWWDQ
jgi:Starch-binding associating with outer membrane